MTDKLQALGAKFILGFTGTKFEDPGVREIIDLITKKYIAGVVLFAHNIISPEQLKTLTALFKSANSELIIAVDEEGGKVQRLSSQNGFIDFKSPFEVSQMSDDDAYIHYSQMAQILADSGINLNFAPCVDVHDDQCPIIGGYHRSFGSDIEQIVRLTRIFKKAHEKYGVDITLKHFPGHGLSRSDTHQGNTDITNYAKPEIELKPYEILASEVKYIMTAHIINNNYDPIFPATLSEQYIKPILRDQFKFKGKVVTDDIIMGAILDSFDIYTATDRALRAGCDLIILSFHPYAMQGKNKLPEDFTYMGLLNHLGIYS